MRQEMRELIEKRLTVQGFTKWLNDWDGESLVGQGSNAQDCPIANYVNTILRESIIFEDMSASVGNPIMYITDEEYNDILIYTIPMWTRKFIGIIDQSKNMESYVSAQECLTIMGDIK